MRRVAGVMAALVVSVGAIFGAISYIGGQPASIGFQDIKNPDVINVGQEVPLQFTVENRDVNPINIDSIGLDTSLLKGVEVVSVEVNGKALPTRAGEKRSGGPMGHERMQYTLNDREIPDGQLMTVTVTLRGVTPGSYQGDVSVWVKSDILGVVPFSRAARTEIRFTVR